MGTAVPKLVPNRDYPSEKRKNDNTSKKIPFILVENLYYQSFSMKETTFRDDPGKVAQKKKKGERAEMLVFGYFVCRTP